MEPYRQPAEKSAPVVTDAPSVPTTPLRRQFNPWLRLALLWTLLLVAFGALYVLTREGPIQVPGSALVGVMAAVVILYAGLIWFYRNKALALSQQNNDGILLLNSGRLDEAVRLYSDLYRRAGRMHSLRALFVTNLGIAHLRRGEPERALEYFDIAHRSGWVAKQKLVSNNAALLLSMGTARLALGDAKSANEWLARAQASVSPARRALLLPLETATLAFEGRFDEAAKLSAERWGEAEALLPGFSMRLLRLLRAHALTSGTRADESAREVDELLAGARPSVVGEFDYIARAWPAFASFLKAHGFSAG
jgi:hypothetical protein